MDLPYDIRILHEFFLDIWTYLKALNKYRKVLCGIFSVITVKSRGLFAKASSLSFLLPSGRGQAHRRRCHLLLPSSREDKKPERRPHLSLSLTLPLAFSLHLSLCSEAEKPNPSSHCHRCPSTSPANSGAPRPETLSSRLVSSSSTLWCRPLMQGWPEHKERP